MIALLESIRIEPEIYEGRVCIQEELRGRCVIPLDDIHSITEIEFDNEEMVVRIDYKSVEGEFLYQDEFDRVFNAIREYKKYLNKQKFISFNN